MGEKKVKKKKGDAGKRSDAGSSAAPPEVVPHVQLSVLDRLERLEHTVATQKEQLQLTNHTVAKQKEQLQLTSRSFLVAFVCRVGQRVYSGKPGKAFILGIPPLPLVKKLQEDSWFAAHLNSLVQQVKEEGSPVECADLCEVMAQAYEEKNGVCVCATGITASSLYLVSCMPNKELSQYFWYMLNSPLSYLADAWLPATLQPYLQC